VGGYLLRIHGLVGLAVDQQAIAAEHHRRGDSVALTDGRDEVTDGGHRRSGEG
jgi:hypothetical protein